MAYFTMDYIRSVVSYVALSWDMSDWTVSVDAFENGSYIEQNFYGVLVPVHVVGKSKGAEIHLRLVLKLAPTEDQCRLSGRMPVMFARETAVYSMVLQRFQDARHRYLMPECNAPNCFYVRREAGKEALVLQDMGFEGYQPFVDSIFVDHSHMRVALQAIARFHACSLIMKERDMKTYSELIKLCEPITVQNHKRYIRLIQHRLDKALEKFATTVYASMFINLSENSAKYVEAISTTKQNCICHGELWKENILFKYEVFGCLS